MQNALNLVRKTIGVVTPLITIFFVLDILLIVTGTQIYLQRYMALFWCLTVTLMFLTVPASKRAGAKAAAWYDLVLAAIALVVGFYIVILYEELVGMIGVISPVTVVMGSLAVLVVLESTRRVTGWPVVILVLVFILYAKFGDLAPGILRTTGLSWERVFTQLYIGNEFMWGIPLKIVVLMVFGFILFGNVAMQTGGSQFLTDLAMSSMGKYRGGPAKVAVVASCLFGTISGAGVANVVSTGVITIPMMKKIGYSPAFAGAIEATASSGGPIMPPVMGAVAFIMAEFLAVPYFQVVIVAIVPALLYYLAIFLQVDLHAAKMEIRGLAPETLPRLGPTLRQGWTFFLPLAVLIFVLFVLYLTPGPAALYATGAALAVALLRKSTRAGLNWRKVSGILEQTTRGMFEITAICAAAGFIVGLVSYTGLALSASRVLIDLSGGNLFKLALLSAAANIIMGMGISGTAVYILVATLTAPAMIQLGVEPLAAHLFVFYYVCLSLVTPPVCMAAYAAASIAKAPQMATALRACRLAVAGFIVPFIFIYNPALILKGSVLEIVIAITFTVAALVVIAAGIEGYFRRKLVWWERALLAAAGVAMILSDWAIRLPGLLLAIILVVIQLARKPRKPEVAV